MKIQKLPFDEQLVSTDCNFISATTASPSFDEP